LHIVNYEIKKLPITEFYSWGQDFEHIVQKMNQDIAGRRKGLLTVAKSIEQGVLTEKL
jgi:hypothetical protein